MNIFVINYSYMINYVDIVSVNVGCLRNICLNYT